MNALYGRPNGDGYPRRPQPEAGRRRAAFRSRAPSGRASAASGCGRTGITCLRQLRRGVAGASCTAPADAVEPPTRASCRALREKRQMCFLRRGRNIILPGQYADGETGLNYNMARDYDPATGRYLESDPAGVVGGGPNTYIYADSDPVGQFDETGLVVQGTWNPAPKFNILDWHVGWGGLEMPHFTAWGYLKFIRLNASATGYVNIDVHCTDTCRQWDVHNRIGVSASGSFDVGPNLYATAIGLLTRSPWLGGGANIAAAGGSLLSAEYRILKIANQRAAPILAALMAYGPTAICLGTR